MRITFCLLALPLWFPRAVRSQDSISIGAEPAQKATLAELALAAQQAVTGQTTVAEEQHPRLFWLIPTYTVSNSKVPVSLDSAAKLRLFVSNTTDPFTVTYTAFSAGVQQANNGLPGYGQGMAGYGKRLGAGLADVTSSGFFRTYLFPSVLHQDPRYFREGSGPFGKRFAHAMIRPVLTRKDSGGPTFNWSGLLGLIAANSLANVYYPATDRGVNRTFRRVGMSIRWSVIDHVIDEFGPDLEEKFLGRKKDGRRAGFAAHPSPDAVNDEFFVH